MLLYLEHTKDARDIKKDVLELFCLKTDGVDGRQTII